MSGIGKDIIVKDLAEKLQGMGSLIITDYRGLKVKEMAELRKRLREAGIEYAVAKNTLARLAGKESKIEGIDQFLLGPTAFAFSKEDPLASAKILTDFSREYPALNIKGGVFEKGTLDPEQVKLWATLPGREDLLAKVAAGFKSPLSNLVFSLKGIMTNFIYALEAIKEKKEQ